MKRIRWEAGISSKSRRSSCALQIIVSNSRPRWLSSITDIRQPCQSVISAAACATTTYREDKKSWRKIIGNGMRGDYSWQHSAKKYMELYNKLAPEQAVPLKEEAKAEPKKDEEE